ncbi:hypothetical protein BaRGS_00000233 [Batillaria attramentaria]|uniref:G-protein coupled receptors family 1 profile domain-containing protein n=1 Tax=Batillaria attramentaria TaxID=370345 RepID=A0ABD0MA66_9CAEN
MYELVGRQVTIVSCEYLDKHDYTVGLRLFGSSSLFFFACLLATTVFCYGKIYHKIRLNHLSLNLVMRSNKIVPMSQATPSGSERSTAHNPRTRSVAEGIFTAASTITQPSPENAQATHNRKVPKSQTGQPLQASAKRLSTDIDATNSHDQNCDRNGSRFSPGAPVTTARRSTLHDEEHDSLDTDSVVFFVGKETALEQSDMLGQDESNTQYEPSSRGSRVNGINLSVPENTYNIFIVSNKRNPAGQQNGGHELFPVETRNKSGLFLKPPSEVQGSFPRVLSRRGSSGNRNRQSDTYPEPFTERSRDSETPKPILPPVASEIWPQSQPSTNSNNRVKPTRSPTIKINGRNFNSMPETHTLRFTKQIRVAKLLLMVTGVFLLSYLPFWVVTFLFMVWPHLDWDQGPVGTVFLSMMYQSYFINNAANPILYAIYSPEFRKESAHLLRLVKQKLCGRQVGVA